MNTLKQRWLCVVVLVCLCTDIVSPLAKASTLKEDERSGAAFSMVYTQWWIDRYGERQQKSIIVEWNSANESPESHQVTTPHSKKANISLQTDSQDWVFACVGDPVAVSAFSVDGTLIREIRLETMPDQMMNFNGAVLIRYDKALYIWKYRESDRVLPFGRIQCPESEEDQIIRWFAFGDTIAVSNGKIVNIYNALNDQTKTVRCKGRLLGFLNEDTLMFTKTTFLHFFAFPFPNIFLYSIPKNRQHCIQRVKGLHSYQKIFEAAFDLSGNYMIAYTNGCITPVDYSASLIDVNDYSCKADLDYETMGLMCSLQWIE